MKKNISVILLCVLSTVFGAVLTQNYYKYYDRDGFPMTREESDIWLSRVIEVNQQYFVGEHNLDLGLDLEVLQAIRELAQDEKYELLLRLIEKRVLEKTTIMEQRLDAFPKLEGTELMRENLENVKKYFRENEVPPIK